MIIHLLALACLACAATTAALLAGLFWDRRLIRRAAARALSMDATALPARTLKAQIHEAWAWGLEKVEARWPLRWRKRAQAWLEPQVGAPRLGILTVQALAYGIGLGAVGAWMDPWLALAGFVLGASIPVFRLRDRARKRLQQLRRALPDAVDLLCACVQAGQGLDQALQRSITQLGPGPLTDELKFTLASLQTGATRREAFEDLRRRCGLSELGPVLKAILRSEARGVALAPVLKAQGMQLRRLWSLRVQKAAAQAPIKMLFPLMVFILPVVFLVVFGPVFIQLTELGF